MTRAPSRWNDKNARLLRLREQGLTYAEIGTLLGVSPGAARSQWAKLHGRKQTSRLCDWKPSSELIRMRDTVAAAFGVTPAQVVGRSRVRAVVHARQAVFYVVRTVRPRLSYPCIAVLVGGRDHSTVIHGVRSVADRMARDPALAERIEGLVGAFGQRGDVRQHDAHVIAWRAVQAAAVARAAAALEPEPEPDVDPQDEFTAALDRSRRFCGQCDRAVSAADAARCRQRFCSLHVAEAA